jgi:hypothetical protein
MTVHIKIVRWNENISTSALHLGSLKDIQLQLTIHIMHIILDLAATLKQLHDVAQTCIKDDETGQ